MKNKFSLMWRVVIALALVLSLGMVMTAPAAAAVTQPEVTVDPTTPATAAIYTIDFTTNEDLAIGDGIVIEFPTGTSGLGSIGNDASDVTGVTEASVDNVGQRLSITLGAVLAAGDITLVVGGTNKVTNPVDGNYTLKVYTSQEPTAVTSVTYMISKALTQVDEPTLSTGIVATAADYTIHLTTSVELRASDAIVVEFPVDTDISAVIKADVTVTDVGAGTTTVDSIAIDGQVLTITLGDTLALGNTEVEVANHIINPTTLLNPDPDTNLWKLTVYTSYKDRIPVESTAYALSEGTAASQIAWLTVDDYVPNDTDSDAFVIQTRDQYGNAAKVTAETTFALTASSGAFYSESTCDNVITTIVIANTAFDSAAFYYKGAYNAATAGTVTITADEDPSQEWTVASTTILVNPELELWGGGSCRAEYNTFADAMAAALPYDTIKVDPSTYDAFTVNQPYLTIESTAGAATTFISGQLNLRADADNSVLGGSSGKGFTLKESQYLIDIQGGPTDVTISYNTLDNTGIDAGSGIQITNGAVAGLTVTENSFTIADLYDLGIFSDVSSTVSGLTVTYNTFTGADKTDEACAVVICTLDISDPLVDSIISDNTMTAIGFGVAIGSDRPGGGLITDDDAGNLEISSNTFTSGVYGVLLTNANEAGGAGEDQNVVITQNTFTSNTYGLAIDYGLYPATNDYWDPEDFTVRYNDFSSNTYGIYNNADAAEALVAQHNWWNDATGPGTDPAAETPTAYGVGDPISAKVTPYSPWLAVSQAVCVPAASPRYAIEIPLTSVASYSAGTWSGGWNTFSTPIWLHQDGDTWGEIKTLANITGDDIGSVYSWDGTTWTTPTDDTVLYPLDAIFVQLKTEQRLPILWGTALLAAPTKTMHAGAGSYTGWELVGQANMTTQIQSVTLDSITGKHSQVIDPISGLVIAADDDMVVGVGYWVFITTDSTLAGFSVTPQTFVPVP